MTAALDPEGRAANGLQVVVGCNGPIGLELMQRLAGRGLQVRGVCRSGRAAAPSGVEVVPGDIGSPGAAEALCRNASVVYSCVGVDYTRWLELWPPIVEGLLRGAESAGARLVFADNLYSYGPHDGPLTEDLPLTRFGKKPALRARMTEELLGAHSAGRVPTVLVRASDFYGPWVRNAVLGERVFGAALTGKSAQLLGDPSQPHSFTFAPDFAKALATVGADDDVWGQIWHVPNAPAVPVREVVERVFRLAGRRPRMSVLPGWLLAGLALVSPMMRELREMGFLWDRPYEVDHGKWAARFGETFTPLDDGLQATLDWYRSQA